MQKYPNDMLKHHFVSTRTLPCQFQPLNGGEKVEFSRGGGDEDSVGARGGTRDDANYLLYNNEFYFWMYYTQTSHDYHYLYFTPSNQSSCPTTSGGGAGDGGLDFDGDHDDGDIGGDFGGGGDGGDSGGIGGGDFGDGGDGGDAGGGG